MTDTTQHPKILEYPFESNVADLLSDGALKLYVSPLLGAKKQLDELTQTQIILSEQLHNENLKVSWSQSQVDLQEMYDSMRMYYGKLVNIKKQMRSIHERSLKLKKRAIRLQNHVEKEQYLKNHQQTT